MPFTLPSAGKVAGVSVGLTNDLNNLYTAVPVLTGINVQNSAYAGGADPTGAADSTAAIQAAINAVPAGGGTVYFPPGTYKTTAALVVATSQTTIRGPGYGYTATIQSAATSAQAGMLILNNTGGVVQQVSVRDLALKGNATTQTFTATNASPCVFTVPGSAPANATPVSLYGASVPTGFTPGTVYFVVSSAGSTFQLAATVGGAALNSTSTGSGNAVTAFCGHGIVSRIENGHLDNVIVQNVSGDAFHFSWDGLATTFIDSMVMINCYASTPGGNGLLIDQYLTSSEFFACHFAGGNAGVYGMNIAGGDLKFIACHPFQFASGGMLLTSTGRECQIIGGEYETNLGPGIDINGGYDTRVIGVSFYGNTSRDVYLRGACKNIEVASSDFLSAINTSIEITGAVRPNIHDNRFDAPSIGLGTATHAVLCNSTFGNTSMIVSNNVINTTGSFGSAIVLADATHSHIGGNRVVSQSAIQESSGADFNTFIGNDVTVFGAGAVQTVGAHSRIVANPGHNPVGKITSPPAVAASTTAVTNSTGVDCMVIVTCNATPNATSISVGGNATGITAATASAVLAPVKVPAGQTITLTYTNAPTWTWWGD